MTLEELIKWERQQKRAYHRGRLSPDKRTKLEALNGWTWDESVTLADHLREQEERREALTQSAANV